MVKLPIKTVKNILALAIIIIGAVIIAKPWYDAWQFDRIQKQVLNMWYIETAVDEKDRSPMQRQDSSATWGRSVAVISGMNSIDDEIWEEDTAPDVDKEYIAGIMEGIITIDKIKLCVPILKKMTTNNLNISICSVIEARQMGQIGNYVLAGHKSRIYGRHFNRLSELSIGDTIVLENESDIFTYRVSDILSVTPSDVWIMDDDAAKETITLITCDYSTNPTGRLVVRGELVSGK